jgi:hypothetical protein
LAKFPPEYLTSFFDQTGKSPGRSKLAVIRLHQVRVLRLSLPVTDFSV